MEFKSSDISFEIQQNPGFSSILPLHETSDEIKDTEFHNSNSHFITPILTQFCSFDRRAPSDLEPAMLSKVSPSTAKEEAPASDPVNLMNSDESRISQQNPEPKATGRVSRANAFASDIEEESRSAAPALIGELLAFPSCGALISEPTGALSDDETPTKRKCRIVFLMPQVPPLSTIVRVLFFHLIFQVTFLILLVAMLFKEKN